MQPIPSEFPYTGGKYYTLFYQCVSITDSMPYAAELELSTFLSNILHRNEQLCTCKHSLIYAMCAHKKLLCRETPEVLWYATEPEERNTWAVLSAGAGAVQGFTGTAYAPKYFTYIEYRAVSGVFRTIDPPPPLHQARVSSPATKAGGYTLARAVRGWGSIFRKTPDIGLASYSLIPLRPILYSTLIKNWIFWEISSWFRKFLAAKSYSMYVGKGYIRERKCTNV